MVDVEAAVPVEHHTAQVNGIRMHYALAGDGPPVILLHGFPETWFAWRKQIPELAQRYSLIVPDLRGYGDTAKPDSGYDKHTMATDVLELVCLLGHELIALVGHDRGARVATRFAKDHRDVVDRLVVMDNIPARIIFDTMDAASAKLDVIVRPGPQINADRWCNVRSLVGRRCAARLPRRCRTPERPCQRPDRTQRAGAPMLGCTTTMRDGSTPR